jgi:cyanophycinase-like exopeptidase
VFEFLASRYPAGSTIAILETPAGFEVNSPAVAERVASYLRKRLKNNLPDIKVIPARTKASDLSPDNPVVIQPLTSASLIFMGPGSPSYTVRQLDNSLAWEMICARFWQGASLVLASAAAIAFGKYALPIYEIYKVGEDLHWKKGLDFFMGVSRFQLLYNQLPKSVTVIGIDEMTSLVIDLAAEKCDVMGLGQIHLIRDKNEKVFNAKTTFALKELGDYQVSKIAQLFSNAPAGTHTGKGNRQDDGEISAPSEIIKLATERQRAREQKDWAAADHYREKIESLGWQIADTDEGFKVKRKK